jgi:hypothetical protein
MRSRPIILPVAFLVIVAAMALSLKVVAQDNARPRMVTFNRDVLPILQQNCQTCHRPGEIAPMSFLSYQEVRPVGEGHQEGCPRSSDAAVVC